MVSNAEWDKAFINVHLIANQLVDESPSYREEIRPIEMQISELEEQKRAIRKRYYCLFAADLKRAKEECEEKVAAALNEELKHKRRK